MLRPDLALGLALTVCAVFVVLALWHFYLVFASPRGASGAVPSAAGKPLFVPSTRATVAVGIALLGFAVLVAATAGLMPLPLPKLVLVGLCYGLAVGLLARAVGEFKYVGFFKRVRASRFATLDTWLYSPLCLLLAIGVAFVALHRGP